MRQPAPQSQDQNGTRTRQSIAPDRNEDKEAVFSRLPGAIFRAALVVLLIATPSILLPTASADGSQIVALMAIFGALFTLVEYSAASPSIIEFRGAPPYNRLRFVTLFLTVLALSFILKQDFTQGSIGHLFYALGDRLGYSVDFPYSPVRLIVLMMPADTNATVLHHLRTAAGIAYLVSLVSIATFVILLRMRRWPKRNGTFNVWVNLPTFDPTAGGDVVDRLNRDSQINLILGFLLPFLLPAVVKMISAYVTPVNLDNPQTLIWMVTAWAFLPASLLMRGVALNRVAQMIYKQRKRAYAKAVAEGFVAA